MIYLEPSLALEMVKHNISQHKYHFSFAVAAVVEGKEGPRTEFQGVKIPPGNGDTSKPRLQIDQKFNTTVVLILSTPDFNSKCEV